MTYKTQKQGQMSASEVKQMQEALISKGYDVGSTGADGIWGANTAAALSQYKKDTGGSNSYGNSVGNETLQKLYGTNSSSSSGYKEPEGWYTVGSDTTGYVTYDANGRVVGELPATHKTVPGTNYTVGIHNDVGWTAYDQLLASQNNLQNTLSGLDNIYGGYVTQLQGGANSANSALNEARQNALAGINTTYDNSARNYYRMYKTQEKELPEQLSSIGATGGATESAALRLMSNYSDNLYKNETARNQNINALDEDYYNAVAQNSAQLASQVANIYYQLEREKINAQNNAYNQQANIYNQYLQSVADQEANNAKNQVALANDATNQAINSLKAAGYDVYTYKDSNGYIKYDVGSSTSKKKVTDSSGSGGGGISTPVGYSYSDIVGMINSGNLSGANSATYQAANAGTINQAQANLIASTISQLANTGSTTAKSTGSVKKKG